MESRLAALRGNSENRHLWPCISAWRGDGRDLRRTSWPSTSKYGLKRSMLNHPPNHVSACCLPVANNCICECSAPGGVRTFCATDAAMLLEIALTAEGASGAAAVPWGPSARHVEEDRAPKRAPLAGTTLRRWPWRRSARYRRGGERAARTNEQWGAHLSAHTKRRPLPAVRDVRPTHCPALPLPSSTRGCADRSLCRWRTL